MSINIKTQLAHLSAAVLVGACLLVTPAYAEVATGEPYHAINHDLAVDTAVYNAESTARHYCRTWGSDAFINSQSVDCYEGQSFGVNGYWCTGTVEFSCS